ncbi:MAG: Acyl-CoA dehydrogenase C-terminal domain-containing protein [Bacteroidales bacterium]|nr:Acyl-CoA dehydrogenase C-terminal domain-containing protein [Bacteroidales bacterium]MDT8431345.1 Acyl-CoA dehydrogenase C-terminal domain-containing protein [Bacteroidales bacterium]
MENFYTDNEDLRFHLNHPLMEQIVALKENNYEESKAFDFAPIDFEDAIDSYDKILEIVGEISGEVIEPNAESVDKEGPQLENNEVKYARGTQENHDVLTKAGLIGMSLPRKYGGLNFPIVPYVMAAEIVSRADAGFANIWGLQDCAETIHEFASEEIKQEFLPRFNKGATAAMVLTEPDAGSDLQAVQLKGQISADYDPEKDLYYLNGVKRFITNGDADIALVLARSEAGTSDGRGLSLFVYDRKDAAVKIRRIENKLGIKGSPTCEMVFTNAPAKLVGDRKLGLIKYVMALMNSARLGIGAQSVGLAEAAYREALKYANERVQFGKAIIQFPAVYEMLTSMKVRTQAIRTLLYETARYVDIYKNYQFASETRQLDKDERQEAKRYQRLADIFTPLLKLVSSEYSNQIAYDSLQIHGGAGFMKDFPIERIYRDARITTIYEGTSQLQVVAAIRGVTAGGFLNRIREFEEVKMTPELEYLKKYLVGMTNEYEKVSRWVIEQEDNEFLDFHARRLVEMAGNIIMGYLLLHDSAKNDAFETSAEIFIKRGKSENAQKADYITSSELKDLGIFRYV